MKDMKDKWEIVFSGVGGQGLILSGTILGETAVMHGKKNAVLTSAYGTETRGTFTKSDVIISKDTIYYPEVIHEDVVLALAQVAYDRYVGNLTEEAVLLYDSDLVSDVKESKAKQIGIPFSRLAQEMGESGDGQYYCLGSDYKTDQCGRGRCRLESFGQTVFPQTGNTGAKSKDVPERNGNGRSLIKEEKDMGTVLVSTQTPEPSPCLSLLSFCLFLKNLIKCVKLHKK